MKQVVTASQLSPHGQKLSVESNTALVRHCLEEVSFYDFHGTKSSVNFMIRNRFPCLWGLLDVLRIDGSSQC